MIVPSPKKIDSIHELENLLDNSFILFCGSAVSGGIQRTGKSFETFLPMVNTVTENFYFEISNRLRNGTYVERTLSRYALELAKGKYAFTRKTRKFEEFLWLLERSTNSDFVNELLYALFRCENGQINQNHLAIAKLLQERKVNFCITTNFDNAIEIAYPKIKVLVHSKNFVLQRIQTEQSLLKLHGDINQRDYIATIPRLLSAEKTNEFAYLQSLLAGKTLLIAGYSGFGDTDIAPHLRALRKTGSKLIWLVKPDSEPPVFATHWFPCDLMALDNTNCLLRLSGISEQISDYVFDFPSWKLRLINWVNMFINTENVERIIDESLEGASAWAKFHIHYNKKWHKKMEGGEQFLEDIDFVKKCLGIGTYYSSLGAFKRINLESFKDSHNSLYSELIYIKGFIYWRLSRLKAANTVLNYFAIKNSGARDFEIMETGLRIYLESIRDRLTSFNDTERRIEFFQKNRIEEACNKLVSYCNRTISPANELLGRLVVLDIKRLSGELITVSDYDIVFQRSMDLQIWMPAKLAALSIIRINFQEGMKRLKILFKVSGGAYSYHTIKHFILALLDRVPKRIINFYDMANRTFSDIPAIVRELELVIRRPLWKLACLFDLIISQ